MVVSKRIARFNRVVTNRVVRPLAAHAPGLGVVLHRGRRSGRAYQTPVLVRVRGGHCVIALVYGAGSDWVKNVMAAGGCELRMRGRRVRLHGPWIVRDQARRDAPMVARPVLRLLGVSEFLHLTVSPPARTGA